MQDQSVTSDLTVGRLPQVVHVFWIVVLAVVRLRRRRAWRRELGQVRWQLCAIFSNPAQSGLPSSELFSLLRRQDELQVRFRPSGALRDELESLMGLNDDDGDHDRFWTPGFMDPADFNAQYHDRSWD